MKTSKIVAFLLLAALVMTFSPQKSLADQYGHNPGDPVALVDYTGSLSIDDGLEGKDGWATATSMSWDIGVEDTYVEYEYIFSFPEKYPSHLIWQVTGPDTDNPFTLGDYLSGPDLDDGDPKWYEDTGGSGSNPNMPAGFTGIKINLIETSDTEVAISFTSTRMPMWGSFYAKDGAWDDPTTPEKETINAEAWNTGLNPSYGGSDAGAYLPVPDTVEIPVPGAVILGILGLGVAGLKLRKYA